MPTPINGSNVQSLYNFMEALNSNNVRTQNLFEMRVFIPHILDNGGGCIDGTLLTRYLNPNFTFYGTGFPLPARDLQYAEVGFKGYNVPVPTVMRMTQEHTVTINADINGDMRRAFLAWQSLTMNPQIDPNGGYFEGHRHLSESAKIRISLLDPVYDAPNRIIETYTIHGVTVASVGTMQFSNTSSELATFDVTFRSQYWQYGIDDSSTNSAGMELLGRAEVNSGVEINPDLIH